MNPGRTGGRPRFGVGRQIATFYTVAVVTAVLLGAGAVVATRVVARDQALADAQRATERLRDVTVAPLLTEALGGIPGRSDELERSIALRIDEGYLTEVTVWGPDGTILFSDDPAVTGTRIDPPIEALAAIDDATVHSAFEDHPEAGYSATGESSAGFVEVYVPMTIAGQAYAFEAYYDYQRVSDLASALLRRILPLVLIPLALLQLIQVPIAGSLARRVRRQEAERSRLLEQALASSEKERVRIAADLHDGPIQDLAGIGYAMGSSSLPPCRRRIDPWPTG